MPRGRTPVLAALALLAVVLGGCRFGVSAQLEVDRDGSGTAALVLTLDEALLERLDELAVDPTAELTAVASATDGWDLTRATGDDGALVLTLQREADDPDALTDAFRELTAGLTDTDPAVALDLDLEVLDDGASELRGTAQLRTPIGPGVVTDEVTAQDLADLAAETVVATLEVDVPGPITASDADVVDGSHATWRLEPGPARTVELTAAPPSDWTPERIAAVLAGALLLVSAAVVGVVLRRRRRQG